MNEWNKIAGTGEEDKSQKRGQIAAEGDDSLGVHNELQPLTTTKLMCFTCCQTVLKGACKEQNNENMDDKDMESVKMMHFKLRHVVWRQASALPPCCFLLASEHCTFIHLSMCEDLHARFIVC